MNKIILVQELLILGAGGLIFYLICLQQKLWQENYYLERKTKIQQQLMEQVITQIHNSPLQMLAFLIREIESTEVSPQKLLKYLREIYQELQTEISHLTSRD